MFSLKKIFTTSFSDYLFLVEAIITSGIIRFIILFIPMRKFASFLGEQDKSSPTDNIAAHASKIEKIRLAVARTSRVTPWRCMCYEQAFTAKILLQRRNIPSTLYFGVRKNSSENKIDAHAWLRTGNRIITGKKNMHTFKEIARFS